MTRGDKGLASLNRHLSTFARQWGDNLSLYSMLYMELFDVPEALKPHLHLLRLMQMREPQEKLLVEDLVLRGASSATHVRLMDCWESMAEGNRFSWHLPRLVDPFHRLSNFAPAPGTPLELLQEYLCSWVAGDAPEAIFSQMITLVQSSTRTGGAGSFMAYLDHILEEVEESGVPLRESELSWALPNLEFMGRGSMDGFLALVEEYNVEWAIASYDWGGGREATLFPCIQNALSNSTW